MEKNKSEISSEAVLTILQKRGIFDDIQKLAETLLPIRNAILSLKKNNAKKNLPSPIKYRNVDH